MFSPTKIIIQKIHVPTNSFLLNDEKHEAVSFTDEYCFCCEVSFNNHIFFTRSLLQDDFIFTVVNNTNDFENIYWGIKAIENNANENQSQCVRNFVLKRLQTIFIDDTLSIEKAEAGCPFLKQQKNLPISFSHHGNYVAYAFNQINFYAE